VLGGCEYAIFVTLNGSAPGRKMVPVSLCLWQGTGFALAGCAPGHYQKLRLSAHRNAQESLHQADCSK
jgi:hypothetical protein